MVTSWCQSFSFPCLRSSSPLVVSAHHSRWARRCGAAAESRKPHGCEGSASWNERRDLPHAQRPSRATRAAPSPLLLLPALLALLALTPALAAPLGGARTVRLERAESQWEGWRHGKGGAPGHGAGVRKRLYVLPAESNAPRPHAAATAAPPATNNSGASSAPARPDSGGTDAGAGAAGAAKAAAIPDERASLLPCPMVTGSTQGGTDGSGGLGGVLSLLRVVQAGDGGWDEGDEAAGQRGSLSRVDPMDGFRRYRGPYNVTDVHYWASAAFTGWWAAAVGVILAAVGVAVYASASFRPIAQHTRDTVITSIAAAITKLDHMSDTLTAAYAVFNRTLSDPNLLLPAQPPPPQAQQAQEQQGSGAGSSVQGGNAGGAGSSEGSTSSGGGVYSGSNGGPCASASNAAAGSSTGNGSGTGAAGGSQQSLGDAVGRVGGEGSGNSSGNGSMDAASILGFARRALVSVHTLQRQAHELEGTVDRVAHRAYSITTTTLISLMAVSCLLLLLAAVSALVSWRIGRRCLPVHLLCMAVLLALLLLAWLLAAVFSSARVMLRDSCAQMALYAATPAASTLAPLLPCINPRAARIARVNAARGANQLVGFANAQIESGNAALGGLARMLRSAGLLESSAAGGRDASAAPGGGMAVASSAVEGAGGAARAGGLRGRGSSMGMVSSSVAGTGSVGGNGEAAVPDAVARTEQSSTAFSPGSNSSSSNDGDRVIPLLCPVFNESSNLAPALCPAGYGSVRSFEQDYAAYHCESDNPVICVRRGTPIPNSSYYLLADAAAATASVADLVPDMYDLATCQFLVDLFQDLSSSPQGCYGAKSKVQLEWVAFILFGVALAMLALACIIALYSYRKREGCGKDVTGQ
ncbi:unnamed protein product [Closterium sp. Yama58-4]|nr:unnamed protein product [Closterium sp. Yama58-4]